MKETIKNLEKKKEVFENKYIKFVLITLTVVFVYFFSFLPRFNSGDFEILKERFQNICLQNLISQNYDPILAQNYCKEYIKENGDLIVKQYEEFYSWEEGRYLTGIDPYYYYRLTKNLVEKGHHYEILKDYDIDLDNELEKVPYDDKQYAPPGHPTKEKANFWVYFQYYSFKIFTFFFEDWKDKLMGFLYWLPVFLAPLASVAAFFIGYRLFNFWIGLLFSLFMLFNGTFLSRSTAGFADTDSLNLVLPLFSFFFFILAFYSKNIFKTAIFGVISALFLALFSWHWQGWWYIFWVIISFLGFKIIQYFFEFYREEKDLKGSFKKLFKENESKRVILFSLAYFLTSALLITFFTSFKNFTGFLLNPIKIFLGYDKPSLGYWPNTLLTVAEASDVNSLKAIMNSVFSFGYVNFSWLAWLGFIGAFYLVYYSIKKKRFELLSIIIWFVAALLFSFKGVRFLMYLAVPLAILSAFLVYEIIRKISEIEKIKEAKNLVKFTLLSIFTIFIIAKAQPLLSKNPDFYPMISNFNDNWKLVMDHIKENDYDVITSWWDFGHYFIAMSKKMVTFDGATQVTPRAFWIGKALQSPENLSEGIITAITTNGDDFFNFIITYLSALELNYSENEALELAKIRIKDEVMNVKKYFYSLKNGEKLYWGTEDATAIGVKVLLEILPLSKENAYKKLREGIYIEEINKTLKFTEDFIKEFIKLTHPENPNKVAFITSEDMVPKAGAWGALGNWDFFNPPKSKEEFFSRAKFYQEFPVKEINGKFLSFLPQDINGDGLLSPGEGFIIKIINNSFLIADKKIKAYIFYNNTLTETKGEDFIFDMLFLKEKNKIVMMSKGMINATFTRMWYLNGHGLKYFKKEFEVKNPRIIVWSLN